MTESILTAELECLCKALATALHGSWVRHQQVATRVKVEQRNDSSTCFNQSLEM